MLLRSGDTSGAALFVDRWQPGASAWLHASRKDMQQRLKNEHFKVITGGLLGINCFKSVPPLTACPSCTECVGTDVAAHVLRCKSVYTGDNNRCHNAL